MVSCTCCFEVPGPPPFDPKGPGRFQPGLPWVVCTCRCGRLTGESNGSFWFRYGKYPDSYDCPATEITKAGVLKAWPGGSSSWDVEIDGDEAEDVLDEAARRGDFGAFLVADVLTT